MTAIHASLVGYEGAGCIYNVRLGACRLLFDALDGWGTDDG